MSKYCPAGKSGCENYESHHTCSYGIGGEFQDSETQYLDIENFEQCPWPSRQQPVMANEHPISQATVEAVCVTAQNAYDSGFRKGQEEMRGRCVTVLTEKCEVKTVRTFDNDGRITTGHAVLVEDAIKHINSLEVKGE